jgi:hypothetical protein
MRSLHMALPFLLFFFAIIIFVGRLADARPYQVLDRDYGVETRRVTQSESARARSGITEAGPELWTVCPAVSPSPFAEGTVSRGCLPPGRMHRTYCL